jgi:hypothetical protein
MKGHAIYRTTASGKKVGEVIRERCYGLKFFENSLLVEEPADPTAFFLGVEAGPGVAIGKGATASAEHSVALGKQASNPVFPSWQGGPTNPAENQRVMEQSRRKSLEDTMDEEIEREQNSDLQLTPASTTPVRSTSRTSRCSR